MRYREVNTQRGRALRKFISGESCKPLDLHTTRTRTSDGMTVQVFERTPN